MVSPETLRTPLFVPADRPDRFEKAAASGADAVILDLEDAVAPGRKEAARASLRSDFTDLPVLVRINATGTPWHEDDLAALRGLNLSAVILPKAEDPTSVAAVSEVLGEAIATDAVIDAWAAAYQQLADAG